MAKHGETPAHVAAAQGHVDCLKVCVFMHSSTNLVKYDVYSKQMLFS